MERPTFSIKVDLRRVATLILYWEKMAEGYEADVMPRSIGEVLRLTLEKTADSLIRKHHELMVPNYDTAVKVIVSRGMKEPRQNRYRRSVVKQMEFEDFQDEWPELDFKENSRRETKAKFIPSEEQIEEAKKAAKEIFGEEIK